MEKIHALLEGMTAREGIPSAIIGVRRGDHLEILSTGLADIETGLAPNLHTIYPIGSCSKAFVATAICMLQEEGLLGLDAPVKRYLPDFALYTEALTEALTLRDMLSHNSGLSTHDLLYESILESLDIRKVVALMAHMPPLLPFRYAMHYQNHMFTLACLLVEAVTGMTWDTFLRQRIFEPLGMSRTFCDLADCIEDANMARPYVRGGDGKPQRAHYEDIYRAVAAAGCINSTIHDMDIWLRLQLGRGQLGALRIFSQKSARLLHDMQNIIRPQEFYPFDFEDIEAKSYGLGWCIQYMYGRKLVAHGGSIRGFRTLAAFLPEDDACFTILCNLEGTSFQDMMAYQLAAQLLGHGEDDWIGRIAADMGPKMQTAGEAESAFRAGLVGKTAALPAAAYTGSYTGDIYGPLEISEDDSGLTARIGTLTMTLLPMGGHDFAAIYRDKNKRYTLSFICQEGAAASVTWNPDGPVVFVRSSPQ